MPNAFCPVAKIRVRLKRWYLDGYVNVGQYVVKKMNRKGRPEREENLKNLAFFAPWATWQRAIHGGYGIKKSQRHLWRACIQGDIHLVLQIALKFAPNPFNRLKPASGRQRNLRQMLHGLCHGLGGVLVIFQAIVQIFFVGNHVKMPVS